MKFRIRTVDMHCYLGRDFHPELTDIGKIVTPVKLSSIFWRGGAFDVLMDDGKVNQLALPFLKDPDYGAEYGNGIETCFTCLTEEGKTLELMDFELEPVMSIDMVKKQVFSVDRWTLERHLNTVGRYVIEASELGLRAGEWPQFIQAGSLTFQRPLKWAESVVIYEGTDAQQLHILND